MSEQAEQTAGTYQVVEYFHGERAAECVNELVDVAAMLARKYKVALLGGGTYFGYHPDAIPGEAESLRTQNTEQAAEIARLRARTHEIQEEADKRYSELVKELRVWEWWKEILARVDTLIAEPGIVGHSANTRAVVGHLLAEQSALAERHRVLEEALKAFVRRYGERCRRPECVMAQKALASLQAGPAREDQA